MDSNSSSSHQRGGWREWAAWLIQPQDSGALDEIGEEDDTDPFFPSLERHDSPSLIPEPIEVDFIATNPFNRNFFFILYCLTTLGLLLFSCIIKGSMQPNKKMEIGVDVLLFLVSVAGPIMYGIWVLINECHGNKIENVMKNNWNIIGSMIPIIIGILNGKMARRD